jgi:hypothetical protein
VTREEARRGHQPRDGHEMRSGEMEWMILVFAGDMARSCVASAGGESREEKKIGEATRHNTCFSHSPRVWADEPPTALTILHSSNTETKLNADARVHHFLRQ